MSYSSTVLADSPVDFWQFSEASGTSAADSGSGNHAATHTSVTVGAGGRDGFGCAYNGTASSTSAASVADFMAGTAFSVEVWVKFSTITADYPTFVRRDGAGRAFLIRTRNTTPGRAYIIEAYDNGLTVDTGTTTFNDGNWHHVVYTRSGGTTGTLYVDGTAYTNRTGTIGAGGTGTTALYIGSGNGTSDWFQGNLDSPAVYTTALSSTRITAHYNAAPIPNVTVTPPVIDFGTGALSTATPAIRIDKTVSAPAGMALTLSSVAPTVTAETRVNESSDSGLNPISVGTTTSATQKVNFSSLPTTPTGKVVSTAKLVINFKTASNTSPDTLHFGQITATGTPNTMTNAVSFVMPSTTTSFTDYFVDVTSIFQNWKGGATNLGFGISRVGTGGGTVALVGTVEQAGGYGADVRLAVVYADASPDVTVTAPAMTATLSTVTPVIGTGDTVSVPAMALSLDTVAPVVTTTVNTTVVAPAQTFSLTFPGGVAANPDYLALPNPMSLTLTAPDAGASIQYPALIQPPAMALSLDTPSGVIINLTTNVLKVVPPMTMTMNMVGIFDPAHDRYFAKVTGTVDADDIWYKMDESSGSRALDSVYGDSVSSTNWTQSGYYWGTPTFGTIGEQLRKAVTFNGSTDYLTVGPYAIDNKYASVGLANDVNPLMATTIEFSIRTTQTNNGVVFAATGAQPQSVAAASPSSSVTALPVLNGCKVTIESGQLVIHDGTNSVKVRKFIADGQWHHVVMAIPDEHNVNSDFMGGSTPHYVQIDGQTILARYGSFTGNGGHVSGEYWLPYSFMAESQPFANLGTGAPIQSPNTINYLAGDLSNVIVRLNSYVAPALAESLYYEWSDAEVVQPPPMTLSLSTVDPSVKGSVKKILAIYGLPWGHDDHDFPLRTYMSTLSGMVIQNLSHTFNAVGVQGASTFIPSYPKAETFYLNGYLVVPVSIMGDSTISGPSSASGVLSPDTTTMDGRFVDDSTGLWRFINLQTDLAQDVIEEYDIITVVNYPWERAQGTAGYDLKIGEQFGTPQPVHGLSMGFATDAQWQEARDAFRDSLLQAAYDGANLWIGEYDMAYHLGFIQGYDMHDAGHWGPGNEAENNKRAWDLDYANTNHSILPPYPYEGVAAGQELQQSGYLAYPQANWYRRIVTLIPDLTDIPGDEYADMIEGWSQDDYLPNGSFIAGNILRRPNGLQLGDQTFMRAVYRGSKFAGELSGNFPDLDFRNHLPIISAHPDGIAGTVVAREMASYYGPEGVVVDNPYKDNAITIAAEVGTVVRGRPIAGRAFIELMDTENSYYGIGEDEDKLAWHGDAAPVDTNGNVMQASFWDFDTRRSKEIKVQIYATVFKAAPGNGIGGNGTGAWIQTKILWEYIQYFPIASVGHTAISMHGRGLYWLGQTPKLNPGDTRVFATAMDLTLTTPTPTLSSVSSPATQVIGPMRLGLQMVKPANFADGNVEVDIFGTMDMLLDMHGLGRVVSVPPMSLTLTTPNPTLDVAADLVTVYLDGDRNITVFLKEDN